MSNDFRQINQLKTFLLTKEVNSSHKPPLNHWNAIKGERISKLAYISNVDKEGL